MLILRHKNKAQSCRGADLLGAQGWEIGTGTVDWKERRAQRAQQEPGRWGRARGRRTMGSRVMGSSGGREHGAKKEKR